ncbi:hypothetical protein T11_17511 [Trichinella zimbabwensis]|uniref:Uncharacterized protein n=1 Tax=Trichinella zimbabwensis TaxID=268475 RepID=A0A0V1HCZ8_9BILA|nr:hypothetical protein T11_17511 [Trichinella zimbabwensis]
MNTDYHLWEIADLLRYSTQLSISKRLLYYKNKTQVQMLLESVTIASGYSWKVSCKNSDKVEDIRKIHRKPFRSVKYSMKLRSLVQYFFVLGNPIFLHFRPFLISLMKVVLSRLEMCIKC